MKKGKYITVQVEDNRVEDLEPTNLRIYNYTTEQIEKIWNTYNSLYDSDIFLASFEEFLDILKVKYEQYEVEFDLTLS